MDRKPMLRLVKQLMTIAIMRAAIDAIANGLGADIAPLLRMSSPNEATTYSRLCESQRERAPPKGTLHMDNIPFLHL
jgi:hypothetical protein